jgi:hypothetical protein
LPVELTLLTALHAVPLVTRHGFSFGSVMALDGGRT